MSLSRDTAVLPARTREAALIRLEGVGRRYRVGDSEVVALSDVSFEVRPEEFVVVRDAARRRC